jgi:hypothetical protein
MESRSGHRTLSVPPISETVSDGDGMHTQPLSPVSDAKGLSESRNELRDGAVLCLFLLGRPAAVLGRVRSIIILAVDGVPL